MYSENAEDIVNMDIDQYAKSLLQMKVQVPNLFNGSRCIWTEVITQETFLNLEPFKCNL